MPFRLRLCKGRREMQEVTHFPRGEGSIRGEGLECPSCLFIDACGDWHLADFTLKLHAYCALLDSADWEVGSAVVAAASASAPLPTPQIVLRSWSGREEVEETVLHWLVEYCPFPCGGHWLRRRHWTPSCFWLIFIIAFADCLMC